MLREKLSVLKEKLIGLETTNMSCLEKRAEILAPAGSFDSVVAAVRCGADAVYLGAKNFSARASAQNFSIEELRQTVIFCHERGVKVYLTLNTSVYDKELKEAAELITASARLGIDALIVSDLGIVSLAREICPELPLHASTQMCIQSTEGVLAAKKLGFERAVLAREMSRQEISDAVKNGGIETEVFVHGALCMSVSGQCYLSSVLGKRSGNRGRCAQPCRLNFSLENNNANYVLSLKDLSLSKHLKELDSMGVTSLKIEGRMKRPEYVAAAVSLVRAELSGETDEEILELSRDIFSRSGFTEGYFLSQIDKKMFGFRSKEDAESSKAAIPRIHERYRREAQRVPVSAKLSILENEPIDLTLSDASNSVTAVSVNPEISVNKAISEEEAKEKISKLGSTPFYLKEFKANIGKNLFVPPSVLNSLRREVCDKLLEMRGKIKPLETFEPSDFKTQRAKEKQKVYARFESFKQLENNYAFCDMAILPYNEIIKNRDKVKANSAAELDRCSFSNDKNIENTLEKLKALQIKWVCIQNISQIELAVKHGFKILCGPFMNVYNSRALNELSRLGVNEAVASFELSSKSLNNLNSPIPFGALVYGYLPLMITRACPIKNVKNCSSCQGKGGYLNDRMGKKMAVKCRGSVSEIYNCVPLCSEISEFDNADFILAYFTEENEDAVFEILKDISANKTPQCHEGFTRGLYRCGVI